LLSSNDHTPIAMPHSLEELSQLWQQRLESRVPVQYLAGAAPWRNFVLSVSPAVLIPRPETEYVIDLAIDAVQHQPKLKQGHWADLGTGSGAIALGLADAFAEASIHAVDRSVDALAVAQQNAQQLGLSDRIQFYQGDWFEPLTHLQGKLSGMVSNPPYIPSAMLSELQPEVVAHEPSLALDGGADGLDCIRHLVATAPNYLIPGGVWLIEMMAGQAEAVANLLQTQGNYGNVQIYPDLAGVDRFALAYRV
jgi:release factor glutamine methyltransferase